jgi:uncharacterized protein YndB with AHSA1/START domain
MSQTENAVVLRVSRTFAAPPERVFDAWTSPELLRRWWAAGPDWDTPLAEVDLRPGGRYRLSMRNTETGEVHTVGGEYREIRRPERLVYTWSWESNAEAMAGSENSLVEVDFAGRDGSTEVTLTHSGFATEELAGMHEHGWNACLDNLEARLFTG